MSRALASGIEYAANHRVADALTLALHRRPAADGVPATPDTLSAERFSVTYSREFATAGDAGRARLRLRLPLPIEAATLRDLRSELVPPPTDRIETSVAPGRLDGT